MCICLSVCVCVHLHMGTRGCVQVCVYVCVSVYACDKSYQINAQASYCMCRFLVGAAVISDDEDFAEVNCDQL
jgi:hypothetical protein